MPSDGSDKLLCHAPANCGEWPSPAFDCDFYREPDTTVRGITLVLADFDAQEYHFDAVHHGYGQKCSCTADPRHRISLPDISTLRFMPNNFPPNAPTDSFFKFELTTIDATSNTAFEIGNCLLDFLMHEVNSALTKLNRAKFSMKAHVFAESAECSVKIRVYQLEHRQFAIEFQRLAGDAVCFNNIFHQASAYMMLVLDIGIRFPQPPPAHINLQGHIEPHLLLQGKVAQAEAKLAVGDLMPLLDMACLTCAPWLQAEVAVALNKMTTDSKLSGLCTPDLFQAIGHLVLTDSTVVAHPTACLVSQLAQLREAANLFVVHGLLPKLLTKVLSPHTHTKVRMQLARALNAAIQMQSGSAFSNNDDGAKLFRAFSDSQFEGASRSNLSNEVVKELEAAHIALKGQFEDAQDSPDRTSSDTGYRGLVDIA